MVSEEWRLDGASYDRVLGAAEILMQQGENDPARAIALAFLALHGANPASAVSQLPKAGAEFDVPGPHGPVRLLLERRKRGLTVLLIDFSLGPSAILGDPED